MSAIRDISTPISRNDIVDLRWQDVKLTVREIFERMAMVLISLDNQSEVSVQLAETRAKNLVCIRQLEVILVLTGRKIEYKTCSNILTKQVTKETLQEGRSTIPCNVVSLKLKGPPTPIRAVVVTEHRNLNTSLTGFANHSRDIIVIMTAGYPCLATREFLRLLAENESLEDTQFLWLSDHDPHGFQVYTTLKFGSASMAWVGPSTCVPRLEFFGPTRSQVEEVLDQSEAQKGEDIKARHPSLSDTEVASKAKDVMKSTRNKFAQNCRNGLNKNDLSILTNVRAFSKIDKKLGVEVENMFHNKCEKFAMSELDKISSAAALTFILQAVDSYVTVGPAQSVNAEGKKTRAAVAQSLQLPPARQLASPVSPARQEPTT
ncbi:MAG: hypothetical protein Q9211_000097 [Gyalolechia sp. 1 TL-2023]